MQIELEQPTKQAIRKDVIAIAWPVFVELLLGSLIGMVNMMMIGRIDDSTYAATAVAAVGLTNQPFFLAVALVQSLNVGATAIISRHHGAKQYTQMEGVIKHVLLVSVCCFIIPLVSLSILFAPQILQFLGAQQYTLTIALPYFKLVMLSVLFTGITMTLSAALRGVGENKIPMRNNVLANIINVLLNGLLIYGYFGVPKLQLLGTGIATLLSSFVSMSLTLRFLLTGKSVISFSFKTPFQFNHTTLKQLIQLGVPSAIEQLLFRLGAMTFTVIVSQLGTVVYAAHQIGLNMWTLSIAPSQAFGIAAATLTGKQLGAKRVDLVKRYVSVIRQLACFVAIGVGSLFYLFGFQLAMGYTTSTQIVQQVIIVTPILAIIQPFLAEQIVVAGALRGAGDTIWPMVATIIGVFIVRTALAYYFVTVLNVGLIGAWWALLGNQIVSSSIVWWRFFFGKWQRIEL